MTYDPNVATCLLFSSCGKTLGKNMFSQHPLQKWQCGNFADSEYYLFDVSAELEKDAHADFLCLHCYPNAVGDNTWAYGFL